MQYDPLRKVSYRKWLAADEDERMRAVRAYHRANEAEFPGLNLHVVIHTAIETQLAMDVFPARATLSRLMKEGLDRHEAIHAMGSVLAGHIFRAMKAAGPAADDDFNQEEYEANLLELTAESWLAMGDEDLDDEWEYEEDWPEDRPDLESLPSRVSTEKMLRDLTASLRDREFESEEELQAALDELIQAGEVPPREPEGDLERAQDLMYQAWEEPDPDERIRMAHKALRISVDCVDAYVILAENEARTFKEMEDLYREGLQVGERVLGEDFFEENQGHFWGILETRPYMRALAGLAAVLDGQGEEEEAIECYKEMIKLNPADNQGARSILAEMLYRAGRFEELKELFEKYEGDAMSDMAYTKALWLYAEFGACKESKEALEQAVERNRYVPDFLLGKRKIPRTSSEYVKWGGPEEAAAYATIALSDWKSATGALFWLRQNTRPKKRRR
jgi:tetratricopeptide (TPR) repeat protein